MKLLKFGITAFLFTLISSCQPPVVFTEPQPKDEPELSRIPLEYHGVYWCEIDSIALVINEISITSKKKYASELSISEIESNPNVSFKNATLYIEELQDSFPAKREGEIITSEIITKDTLYATTYATTGEKVLKHHKGHLILNSPIADSAWGVTIISLEHPDALSIKKTALPSNLDALESITPVDSHKNQKDDSVIQIKISPTKAEFNQIISEGVLFDGSCVDFKRVYPTADMSF